MATLRSSEIRVIGYRESLRTWMATHWSMMHRFRRWARRAARRRDYHTAHRLQQHADAHRLALHTLIRIRKENEGGLR